MKKIVTLIFVIIMLLLLSGCNNNDGDSDLKANPASDFEYTLNSDQSGILINKYVGTSENVVVPSEIDGLPVLALRGVPNEDYPTTVKEGVFAESNIKTVVIPATVKSIGGMAFADCRELSKVTVLPNSDLISIIRAAFGGCVKLEKLDLSDTKLELISTIAFMGCTNLTEIKFPDTLKEIGEKAFYECSALKEVDLPRNLTKIKDGAFGYCTSLERIVIPPELNIYCVGDEPMFHNAPSLKQIVFEDGREEINGYALVQTDASVEITVPESVKEFSPATLLIASTTPINLIFKGDAPKVTEDAWNWFGVPTVYYDPDTNGWENSEWDEHCTLKPINEK